MTKSSAAFWVDAAGYDVGGEMPELIPFPADAVITANDGYFTINLGAAPEQFLRKIWMGPSPPKWRKVR